MEWIEITAETPLEEVQRMHKQIWDYVMEHGEKPGGCPYKNHCAAYEWAHMTHIYECRHCPIKWPDVHGCKLGSLFDRWCRTRSPNLARQIRDVEFKTKEEI